MRLVQVHSKSKRGDFGAMELVSALSAAGDPLHLMAADALVQWRATAERLQERVSQLEAIARLNGETIRNMQQAAVEAAREQYLKRQSVL